MLIVQSAASSPQAELCVSDVRAEFGAPLWKQENSFRWSRLLNSALQRWGKEDETPSLKLHFLHDQKWKKRPSVSRRSHHLIRRHESCSGDTSEADCFFTPVTFSSNYLLLLRGSFSSGPGSRFLKYSEELVLIKLRGDFVMFAFM